MKDTAATSLMRAPSTYQKKSTAMAGLRDQLLKSGLVNEKQVKKAQREKSKEQQQNQQMGKAGALDEDKRRLQQSMAEKAERDRQLNLKRKEEAEKKAIAAQVRQLIETARLTQIEGDTAFNFADAGKVKRLYLTEAARNQLVRGQAAIVKLDSQYHLVPRETSEKIRQRDESAIVLLNEPSTKSAQSGSDDPYADFQVPDDLMW